MSEAAGDTLRMSLGVHGRRRGARLFPWLHNSVAGGEDAPGRVTVHTLTTPRWVAVVGQLFTILFVHFSLGIELPLAKLLLPVALSTVVNLVLLLCLRAKTRLPEPVAAGLYAYDILQLGVLLALTGGVQNPFTPLILLPIALAAATLELRSIILVTLLSILVLIGLTLLPGGLPWRHGPLILPRLYQLGTAAGLIIATVLIAGFAWSIAESARRHADALSVTQLALAREQQLSALGGQAAAAAHLLGTPLGTITIIAKELVRELPEGSPLAEDARELHAQAQRCRELLRSLGRPPDSREHDPFTSAPMTACLEQIAARHGQPGIKVAVELQPLDDTPEPVPHVTPEFRHAIANLIENATQFARSEVRIVVRPSSSGLVVVIEDDGPGFSAEVLDWVGEPFLSTGREQGGLGLGIFIAITLLARGGARLQFDNTSRGARVTISWPPDAFSSGAEGVGQ